MSYRRLSKLSTPLLRASFSSKVSKEVHTDSGLYVKNYRPLWTDFDFAGASTPAPLPKRTVSDSALNFQLTATFTHGSAIFFPHLKMNPADAKVKMTVSLKDLNLSSPEEVAVFRRMAGARYNPSTQILKLTSARFANRLENKEYLVLELENLLVAVRELVNHKNDL